MGDATGEAEARVEGKTYNFLAMVKWSKIFCIDIQLYVNVNFIQGQVNQDVLIMEQQRQIEEEVLY